MPVIPQPLQRACAPVKSAIWRRLKGAAGIGRPQGKDGTGENKYINDESRQTLFCTPVVIARKSVTRHAGAARAASVVPR